MTPSARSSRALSSKVLCSLCAALILTQGLGAQTKVYSSADEVRKAVSRLGRKAEKSSSSAVWMELASAYEDAYRFPLSNIVPGEGNSVRTLVVKGQRPREIMAQTSVDGIYKNIYSDKDVFFNADGVVLGIVVTRPVLDTADVLRLLAEAAQKAYRFDSRGRYRDLASEKISFAAREYHTMAQMRGAVPFPGEAGEYLRKAADVSLMEGSPGPDTSAVYETGLYLEEKGEPALAAEYYRKALELGYAGETGGDLYYHLASVQQVQGEDTLETLEEGVRLFPDNQRLAAALSGYQRALSAEDYYAEGEAHYRAAREALRRAMTADDRALQREQGIFEEALRSAEAPLLECIERTTDETLRRKAESILREIRLYFAPAQY